MGTAASNPARSPASPPITRLAPSPTGALHLGNARTFLINWALARRNGWKIVMRIEDLDGPRIKLDADRVMLDTLAWLGLDWDSGPTWQSHDLEPYRAAMRTLAQRALVFPCDLTRAQIEAASSAPQQDGPSESRFPRELRPGIGARAFSDESTNWRFVVGDDAVSFTDAVHGPVTHTPADSIGDFVVWTKRGTPSYQLAVVVDDARQGVTHVVRGDDLLDSTSRQILLYRALGLREPGTWMHLPLVVGEDGKRLAKRHGDTRLLTYRERGVAPERIVGLLAYWSGVTASRTEMDAREFAQRFDVGSMSKDQTVFSKEDEAWLLGSS
ncbi:MAG: tRNA glutamyl-Q(34) synthetase GluQRS [Phycisphaerales bacterium]